MPRGEGFERVDGALVVVDDGWRRTTDGRLTPCAVRVRVQAPSDVPDGWVDVVPLDVDLAWSG